MNLDNLNKWLTLLANLGVLGGIFILILEINQNTRATEAQVTWEHNNSVRELYYPEIMDPVFRDITLSLREKSYEDISLLADSGDPVYRSFSLWFNIQMNMWEARFYTQTSEIERQRLRSVVLTRCTISDLEVYQALVSNLDRFRPEFQTFFESIQQELRIQYSQ